MGFRNTQSVSGL